MDLHSTVVRAGCLLRRWAWVLVCLTAWGSAALDDDPLVAQIRETPPHEVPLSQWRAWADTLRARVREHGAAGRHGEARELALFAARMMAGPGRDRAGAVDILRSTRRALPADPALEVRSLFLAESEWLGRMGDREALRRLMDEYRTSPYYRPDGLEVTGGRGPRDPLRVRRPHAAGFDDPVLTTMERHARMAGAGMDGPVVAFELRDIDGQVQRAEMYRGRWLLLDFWVHGTVAWRRALDARAGALRQWGDRFSILGVCQNLDADALRAVRRQMPDMAWPQVDRRAGAEVLRVFGVFGENRNVLVAPDGRVVARDVNAEDLPGLLRREIGDPSR